MRANPYALTDEEREELYQRVRTDPSRRRARYVSIHRAEEGPDPDGFYRIGIENDISKSQRGSDNYVWWNPERDEFRYDRMPPPEPRPLEPWQIAARNRERARTPPVSLGDLHKLVNEAKARLARKIGPDKTLRAEISTVNRYVVSRQEREHPSPKGHQLGLVATIRAGTVPPQTWLVLSDYQTGLRVLREVKDGRRPGGGQAVRAPPPRETDKHGVRRS